MLQEARAPSNFVIMPGVRHGALGSSYALEYHSRVAVFLLERLVAP